MNINITCVCMYTQCVCVCVHNLKSGTLAIARVLTQWEHLVATHCGCHDKAVPWQPWRTLGQVVKELPAVWLPWGSGMASAGQLGGEWPLIHQINCQHWPEVLSTARPLCGGCGLSPAFTAGGQQLHVAATE